MRIHKLRKEKGITLEHLAYENGMSKGNLSKIEKGLVDPQFTTLAKIAHGLGIKLKDLMNL
ncbi:helix-turn-helix transcriptional regulator [bacterium]|nr:helix-turn-helix transcriptional regulator [bacterium]